MLRQSTISSGTYTSMVTPNVIFSPQLPAHQVINSRFGEIAVDATRAVAFPNGLLGMPDKNHFVLANFSNQKMQQFNILQSLDDLNLSFIVLPLELNNNIIETADIRGAADDLLIVVDDLLVLLVVSVHRSPSKVRMSVNARAPLFIDAKRKFGTQYVFKDTAYKVQQML